MKRTCALVVVVFLSAVPQAVAQKLEKREYSLAFAIPRQNGRIIKEKSKETGNSVMTLFRDTLTCFRHGAGRMEYDPRRHVLVVHQTVDGHEEIAVILDALQQMIDRANGIFFVDVRGASTTLVEAVSPRAGLGAFHPFHWADAELQRKGGLRSRLLFSVYVTSPANAHKLESSEKTSTKPRPVTLRIGEAWYTFPFGVPSSEEILQALPEPRPKNPRIRFEPISIPSALVGARPGGSSRGQCPRMRFGLSLRRHRRRWEGNRAPFGSQRTKGCAVGL